MVRRQEIVCECGGRLTRPIPSHCPHCQTKIGTVRQGLPIGLWFQLFSIIAMFAVLAGVAYWLAK